MESYQTAKEEVKRVADIVQVIGQHVQLKRAGQNYLGLCPFHSEKTPSFTVSPAKQMFHCFGCKKGGDVYAFWMDYYKVSFVQALNDLADRFHVDLPREPLIGPGKKQKELNEVLFRINKTAAEYFNHILLKSEKGEQGRKYLAQRSIPAEIITAYHLGYAPDEWNGLTQYFEKKGLHLEKVLQAGLIIPKKSGGYYDRFRGRVIFPILDVREQIVGFGGRVLDNTLPKYLNTPETPIFHKGEILYGLHAAHGPIRNSGRAIIVEGYMDVLGLRNHGVQEAVATLGTALTNHHVRVLKGYAREIIVVFDSDMAGEKAALKSLAVFLEEGLTAKILVLPEGDDPDSFVNKHGRENFLELINHALPMFEYFLDRMISKAHGGVEGKVDVLKEILPVLSNLSNAAQCSIYARRLAEKIDIPESVVLSELRKMTSRDTPGADRVRLGERISASRAKKVDGFHLLNLVIHYPDTMARLMHHDYDLLLSDPSMIELLRALFQIYKNEGKMTPADIMERLEVDKIGEQYREALLTPPIYTDDEVEQAVIEFEKRIHNMQLSEDFNRAGKQGDLEKLNQLLKRKMDKNHQVWHES